MNTTQLVLEAVRTESNDVAGLTVVTGLSATTVRKALKTLEASGAAYLALDTMTYKAGDGVAVVLERSSNPAERGAPWA